MNSLFYFFYNFSHKSMVVDQVFVFITDSFGYFVIGAAVGYLFYFFASHPKWKEKKIQEWIKGGVTVGISMAGAYAVAYILKIVFHAPRPFVGNGDVQPLVAESMYDSFPSAHATVFFALAMVVYKYNKKAGGVFFLFALIIAISRMVVGVHYPIDLIGGAVIGTTVAYLIYRFVNSIFSRKNL